MFMKKHKKKSIAAWVILGQLLSIVLAITVQVKASNAVEFQQNGNIDQEPLNEMMEIPPTSEYSDPEESVFENPSNTEEESSPAEQEKEEIVSPLEGESIEAATEELSEAPESSELPSSETNTKDFAISCSGDASGYHYEQEVLTFNKSGNYTVSTDGVQGMATDRIVIAASGVTLTLNNVSIDASASGQSALLITADDVTLQLQGSNFLSSGSGSPGIQSAGNLVIDGGGQLTVSGSIGIKCSGNLTINNGTINATGSTGPGISGAIITINNGAVFAVGHEVGIEGSVAVTINEGNVSASNLAGEKDSIRPKLPTEIHESNEQEELIEKQNTNNKLESEIVPAKSGYILQIPRRLSLNDQQATELPVNLVKDSNYQQRGTASVELVNEDAQNHQLVLEKIGDSTCKIYSTIYWSQKNEFQFTSDQPLTNQLIVEAPKPMENQSISAGTYTGQLTFRIKVNEEMEIDHE